ncbi:MAG TPA: sporulation initiation factor Spo0A [Clostridiales bacterium]|nr:sporulation initiation factor Spo0A [Clostridiales bacterium]
MAKEVEREIQIAIDSGFDNPDAKVRAEWAKVPFKGERPTSKEVIEYLCKEMKKNQ